MKLVVKSGGKDLLGVVEFGKRKIVSVFRENSCIR